MSYTTATWASPFLKCLRTLFLLTAEERLFYELCVYFSWAVEAVDQGLPGAGEQRDVHTQSTRSWQCTTMRLMKVTLEAHGRRMAGVWLDGQKNRNAVFGEKRPAKRWFNRSSR